MPHARIISAVLLAAVLGACGFHLQQESRLPPNMAQVRLDIRNPYNAYARRLSILLEQAGMAVVTGDTATAILEIPVNSVRKEILTIGDNARVREYRIRHTVSFRLVDGQGTVLVPEQTLEQSRVISFDEQDILGAAQEEEFLRNNLADNLARLTLRRLGSAGS
jgi:LPS-assembly lipoprotein